MNRDVFLSILAMDSYNRGYGQGVLLSPGDSITNQNEAGRQLGNATILNIDLPSGSVAAGFYAIAYRVSGVAGIEDGTKVISYRGTNFVETWIAPAPAYAGATGEAASISSGMG